MFARRLSLTGLALLFSFESAVAQEPTRLLPSEPVPNWTAPPYWTPPSAMALEKLKESGVLEPMAVETVPTGPLPFFGITPCRLVDTRPSQGFTGAYGPPILLANATRDFDLNSAPQCPGVPASAQAYSLNITITETQGPGDVRIWPTGTAPLNVSTQNWSAAGIALANAAIVPAGTNGSVTVQIAGSNTHLIIDINGYYAPVSIVNTVNGLSGDVTLAAGSNITITPSGQTLTIAAPGAGAAWFLTGNSGTTPGTNFLGTTDNQRLEIKVNNQRVFRLEPTTGSPNVIGGDSVNSVMATIRGATIGGGGASGFPNSVLDDYGTVSGGYNNLVGDGVGTTLDRGYATVGGGYQNIADGVWSTVGGGSANHAAAQQATVAGGGGNHALQVASTIGGGSNNNVPGFYATVAGGANNNASGNGAAIGGGVSNVASGSVSPTIPGGSANAATGNYSLAAGRRAKAVNDGAWVWGDSTDLDVSSTGADQFIVRASGGIWLGTTSAPSIPGTDFLNTSTGAHLTTTGIWTNNSDRESKENFEPLNRRELLARLEALPIATWNYKLDGISVRHVGPTAQDFAAQFGLGSDDHSIGTLDADGVALAAIQALYELVREKDCEIEALKARVSKLEESAD